MNESFARSVLRIAVAQICQNMGWHAVQTTPMELLVDALHRYLVELGRTTHRYSEQFGRIEPNLDDLGLAFKDIGVPVGELEDFVNNVEPVPFTHEVPKFPVTRMNNFQFPKPGSREVHQRPECIDEHLPLLYPDADDDDFGVSPNMLVDGITRKDSEISPGGDGLLSDGVRVNLKRPLDIEAMMQTPKRARLFTEDEGRPMREVTSVFMTAAGVISPVREGKLPEAKTPSKLAEDSRPTTPVSPGIVMEPKKDPKKDTKKDGKKEVKKDDKKSKDKKDRSKDSSKKVGKKEKDKKENKENKKKIKYKIKPKLGKSGKDGKVKVGGPSGSKVGEKTGDKKFIKSKHPKLKPPKLKQNKLKPFLTKSKMKSRDLSKLPKPRPKKKPKPTPSFKPTFTSPKSPKSPKGPKSPIQAKSPRVDKSPLTSLAQLATLAEPLPERDITEIPLVPEPIDSDVDFVKSESQQLSGEDSPERLVIDDDPATIERQERECRMAAVNESIDAAIQRGLKESELERVESNRGYDQTIEDVVRMGSDFRIKLEPRDVYDFTDDENSPPATPATPRTPEAVSSPVKPKKSKKENLEVGKKLKDKLKEKIKLKSKDSKGKSKSSVSPKLPKVEQYDDLDENPKTPEPLFPHPEPESPVSFQSPFPRMPGTSQFSHFPYFNQISQVPPALLPYPPPTLPQLPPQFQAHTPPNMPMPPVGFYVRNPKPECMSNIKSSFPISPINPSILPSPPPQMSSVLEKPEDTPSKVQKPEKVETAVEKGKGKEHKREKKPKEKGKEKEVEKMDDGLRPLTKKKKEKVREKEKKKTSKEPMDAGGESDKGKPKGKDKEKVAKPKEKVKEEKKPKMEKKDKKKKDEKLKEDKESSASPSGSAIPKMTIKLGSTSASEGTKIFIKPPPVPVEDSPPSRSSSPSKEPSPPPAAPVKAHPKPQSKVNPVPAAPKPTGPQAAAPARTVITETVGTIIDASGNKIWICPACTRPDDGSPMIGCDECDDWYHWVCVGIVVPPKEEENWFCNRCIAKKQNVQKKKKKKHRKDKAGV